MAGDLKVSLEGIGGLMAGAGELATKIREAITGKSIVSAKDAAELEMKALEIQNKAAEIEAGLANAQSKINEIEASSTNIFIAGWRPAIGWIGALVIFYCYVVTPILAACKVAVPDASMGELWPLITGILGLGGMRTYEKKTGSAGNH
jgi:roadblock/LC7 domain-containing protein